VVAVILFLLAMVIVGATAGGVVARLTASGGMGWDQLARGLGGMMIGAVAGLAAGIVGTRRLRAPWFGRVATLAVLAAAGLVTLGVLQARRATAEAAAQQAAPPPVTVPR
jgi:hypothetical protein